MTRPTGSLGCLLASLTATLAALLLGLSLLAAPATAEDGATGEEPTEQKPSLVNTERPTVSGEARDGRVLEATPGRWTPRREETRYRWLRDGRRIRGATARRYRLTRHDVNHRIRVEVRVRAAGHLWTAARSRPTRRVAYRVPVRRRVTYHVETRGRIHASVRTFARLAQQSFDDPRGWRAGGTEFRRVRSGGDFSLVLAEASRVDDFSSQCSTFWSCRVGRYVVINQDRWLHASPGWNAAGGSLRGYRHMVVNHETGHWLGRGHRGCPGPGRLAPVMMQQSKGLDGCRFNPWPTRGEL